MNTWNMLMDRFKSNSTNFGSTVFHHKILYLNTNYIFFSSGNFSFKMHEQAQMSWLENTISFPDPSHYTALRTVPTNSDSHFHAPLNSILHCLKRTSRVGCITGRPLEYERKSSLWRRDPFHAGK